MTLAAATALNPYIGYDKGAEIVKTASQSGRPLREVALELGVDEETYEKAMDLRKMAQGQRSYVSAPVTAAGCAGGRSASPGARCPRTG